MDNSIEKVTSALLAAIVFLGLIPMVFAQLDNRSEMDCDRLAGVPGEKELVMNVPGVVVSEINAQLAVPACEAAVRDNPGNARLIYQLGRAIWAAKKHSEAIGYFQQAASLGYGRAFAALGSAYGNGEGVGENQATAANFYRKGAELGDPVAMDGLSRRYAAGKGVDKDYNEARRWAEKAANLGNTNSMFRLGVFYERGDGVARDYALAKGWYEKAASLKSAAAAYNLGVMYQKGVGVSLDLLAAKGWYEKAAQLNDASGMYYLALLYERGHPGISQDLDVAFSWYKKAAALGHADSQKKLADEPAVRERARRRAAQLSGRPQNVSLRCLTNGRGFTEWKFYVDFENKRLIEDGVDRYVLEFNNDWLDARMERPFKEKDSPGLEKRHPDVDKTVTKVRISRINGKGTKLRGYTSPSLREEGSWFESVFGPSSFTCRVSENESFAPRQKF